MLNRVEYVTAINEYDRQMLEEYENTIQKIADKKVTLEGQQTELEEISGQLENEKGQVQEVVAETQQVLEENNAALDDAQSTADQYDQQIEDQMAYEAELEAQKAREDAERMAEIKRQEEEAARAKAEQEAREREEAEKNQNSDGGDDSDKPQTPVSASDQTLLAALIHCEAAGESYEGKLAVGSVVMNRVASSYYPNSIAGVIYQSGQFSPVASGRFATVLASGGASADSSRAASEVLAGNITNSFLYFRTIIPGIEGLGKRFYLHLWAAHHGVVVVSGAGIAKFLQLGKLETIEAVRQDVGRQHIVLVLLAESGYLGVLLSLHSVYLLFQGLHLGLALLGLVAAELLPFWSQIVHFLLYYAHLGVICEIGRASCRERV